MSKWNLCTLLILFTLLSACGGEPALVVTNQIVNYTSVTNRYYTNLLRIVIPGAPQLTATYPANNATGIPVTTNIILTFDQDMTASSLNSNTFIVRDYLGLQVKGAVSYAAKQAKFTPSVALLYSKPYTVSVSSGIKGVTNNSIGADYTFGFTMADYVAVNNWDAASWIETITANWVQDTDVGLDFAGNAFVVMNYANALCYVSRYVVGTGWTKETNLGVSANCYDVRVAVHSNGAAIAVWTGSDGDNNCIFYNVYKPGVGWRAAGSSPVGNNTGGWGESRYARIAFFVNGDAICMWKQNNGSRWDLWASYFTYASDVWSVPKQFTSTLPNEAGDNCRNVATAPNGKAMAVWHQVDASGYWSIYASEYSGGAGGNWSAPTNIEVIAGNHCDDADVKYDSSSKAIAIYHNSSAGTMFYSKYNGTIWSTNKRFDSTANTDAEDRNPYLVVDKNNNFMAAWRVSSIHTYVCRFTNGVATQDYRISDLTTASDFPRIAMNPNGVVFVVWGQNNTMGLADMIARRFNGTSWDSIQIVDNMMGSVDWYSVGVSPNGSAVASWTQSDGQNTSIFASRFH